MSLVRACVRIAAVAALRDRAWPDVRIYDSDQTPLSQGIIETPAPYVVVYTDEDNTEEIDARSASSSGTRKLSLVIETGIAAPLPPVTQTPVRSTPIPATDSAYELVLDMLDRQVFYALWLDPRSSWGEIMRLMVPEIISTASIRGGSAEKGVRWAARQRTFVVAPIWDPAPGFALDPSHPIAQFMNLALAAPVSLGINGAASILADAIAAADDFSWRKAQAILALTSEEITGIGLLTGIGLAPAVDIGDEEAPPLETVNLLDEDEDVTSDG